MSPRRVVAFGFLLAGAAFAAEPSVPGALRDEASLRVCGGAGPDTLDIEWVGLPDEPALEHAVCDWFREEKWRVRFASHGTSPATSDHSLHILVTLPSLRRARLSIDVASRQHWLHEVELAAGLGEAGIEVIAEALHSVAQAAENMPSGSPVLDPTRPETARPETARPKPVARDAAVSLAPLGSTSEPGVDGASVATVGGGPPTPRVAPGRHLPVRTGVGYLAFLRGDEPVWHGPALHLALDWPLRTLTAGGFFRAALLTAGETRLLGLRMKSTGVSLGSGVAARVPLSAFGLLAAIGGSMDLIALDVEVLDPGAIRLARDLRARPRFFLGAEAGADWRVGAFELGLSALLRWQLSHTTYQVRDADELVTVLDPWRLQPGVSMTAAYVW